MSRNNVTVDETPLTSENAKNNFFVSLKNHFVPQKNRIPFFGGLKAAAKASAKTQEQQEHRRQQQIAKKAHNWKSQH